MTEIDARALRWSMDLLIFFDAVKKDVVVRNKALCLPEGCCPTARMLATTNNDALHLNKEEAFSHAAVAKSLQLIAFGDDEPQSSNGSQTNVAILGNDCSSK
jgi:hypothetical protein